MSVEGASSILEKLAAKPLTWEAEVNDLVWVFAFIPVFHSRMGRVVSKTSDGNAGYSKFTFEVLVGGKGGKTKKYIRYNKKFKENACFGPKAMRPK
ncbi:hypothetical protein HY090_01905 [Candidatus Kaiserbacteria bacterium]|nr:hypothetical protein [Candidatus Kaiserbacteria bacterium]